MPGMGRRQIGDAGDNHLAAVAIEYHVIVLEHPHPHFSVMSHPGAITEKIFVVARDDIHPVGSAQVSQRIHVRASRARGCRRSGPRSRRLSSRRAIRPLDDGTRPFRGEKAADVEIGQLQQRVTVELRREPPDADLDILQWWHP